MYFSIICSDMERTRLDVRDTMSVTSGDPEGTTSSLASGGRNHSMMIKDPSVDPILGSVTSDEPDSSTALHSNNSAVQPKSISMFKGSAENVTECDEILVPQGNTDHSFLGGLKPPGSVPDSADNSSCGSFPENGNGVIMYDRNYSLSPPPPCKEASVDSKVSLDFLNPNFSVPKTSDSPNSLTDDSFVSSLSPDSKTDGTNGDGISPDANCDRKLVMETEPVPKPVENESS